MLNRAQQRNLFKMALGEHIKRRRETIQVTQQELASRLGSSFRQVSLYEAGELELGAINLSAISDALNVSADWLLGRAQNQEQLAQAWEDLSEDEFELLAIYRNNSEKRAMIDKLIHDAYEV
jgi:transcriptional regulator with XRE-family HTH domain